MMQPYRLPAIFMGRPVMIVAFDPTHVLVVDDQGGLRYLEHNAVTVSWVHDSDALVWMEFGYAPDPTADASDDPDADTDDNAGDTR